MAEPESAVPSPDAGIAPPAESLRDDVARAFEEIETRDAPPATPATPPGPAAAQPGAPAAPKAPGAPSADDRPRDPAGRFVPKEGEPAPKLAPEAKPQAPAAPAKAAAKPAPAPGAELPKPDAAPQLRAPASWKAPVREHWTKLPPEVQAEVHKREAEIGKALQETAGARQAVAAVQQVLAPFSNNIRASGSDALGAIQNFFQADHTLRHGSIVEKAQLVASIMKQYAVDIPTLDSVLAGATPQADPNAQLGDQIRRELSAQLQPVLGFFDQVQGQRAQAFGQLEQQAGSEVETFGQDAAHEYFDDVREDMADIIEMATRRGQTMTLQDAYDRATKLNPQVSEILAKRAETERAAQAAQAAQRARRTAASVASGPAPAGVPGPSADDRRAVIEAAWDANSGG